MRYYAIKISPGPKGPLPSAMPPAIGINGAQFTSVVNGKNDPAALDILLQMSVGPQHTIISGQSFLRIWGVPLQLIAQANQFYQAPIEIYGGMSEGLPLATFQVKNQGLLTTGTILPAFGNWLGSEITLDFTLAPGKSLTGSPNAPKNIVHNWPANTPLSQSLKTTLSTAFPTFQQNIKISPNLKLPYPDIGFYNSFGQFAQYIHAISMSILRKQKNYKGVKATITGNTMNLIDNDPASSSSSSSSDVIVLDFKDLIGQPTWINYNEIKVNTILRSDINVDGKKIKLPPGLITLGSNAAMGSQGSPGTNPNSNLSNTNTLFSVTHVDHYGHFRQNDSFSWVTSITALTP